MCSENVKIEEISPKIDRNDPLRLMKTVLYSHGSWIDGNSSAPKRPSMKYVTLDGGGGPRRCDSL